MAINPILNTEPKIVKTDEGAQDGQSKCPNCGSTDISVNAKTGKLRCNFCRHEFEPEKIESLENDITKLKGDVIGKGAQDIEENTKKQDENIITLKCTSCGAEVVIDTNSTTQARCHWCRNTLSINEQIPNGAVPDLVLPFNVTKAEAKQQIEQFVGKRKFFAHPKFKEEFTGDNIMGVYFPYMVVDINSHAHFLGKGEQLVRKYSRKEGDSYTTYYDADLYEVERDFDLTIEGLTVESSSDKLEKNANKTNNIINTIMPFDTENCVKYNANYLKGYTSERRDTNIDQLKPIVEKQSTDIARFAASNTIGEYDRGVHWELEQLQLKGKQWKTAYLPVWLYSFQQVNRDNTSVLHYVAVNARTKETMGSVPIHMPKLIGVLCMLEIIGFLLMFVFGMFGWLFQLGGCGYCIFMYLRYRNLNQRHHHETETKRNIINLKKIDNFIKHRKGLTNSKIMGDNTTRICDQAIGENLMNSFTNTIEKKYFNK